MQTTEEKCEPDEDHKEIWLEPKSPLYAPEGRLWCQDDVWEGGVRYIRADYAAELIEQTITEMRLQDNQWARAGLLFAARAVRRGRHLTAKEKLENFTKAMAECEGDEE